MRIERWPALRVVGALICVEWVVVLALALTVRHNGWVYYQGGDQLWYYTLGWLLGHGHLWQTPVGYGWPTLLAPVAAVAGPNLVSALPAIVLFNVLILLPVAMAALYGIAARIGGRLFGYWALVLWITVPLLGILYTNPGYHQRYTELTLPQSLGLTAMSDFPAMVATVISLYFCARVVLSERPELLDALAAGAAGGFALGIKPATAFFLVGPALAFAARRYLASAAAFVGGLLPAIVALAVWKDRGLGYLPAIGHAGGRPFTGLASGAPALGLGLGQYFHSLAWARFLNNLDLLREHFWSGRLLEWLFVAGLIGLGRRSPRGLLLIGGAIVPFAVAKASYVSASVEDASVFRILMPCFPGFIVALACLPFLVPRPQGYAPVGWSQRRALGYRARIGTIATALVLTCLVPLVVFAVAGTGSSGPQAAYSLPGGQMPIPVGIDIGATARETAGQVRLSWAPQHPAGGHVFYRVWRAPEGPGLGLDCPGGNGGPRCKLVMDDLAPTTATTFADRPPPGRWVYRVAVAANWLNDPGYGDPYLASTPLRVRVP